MDKKEYLFEVKRCELSTKKINQIEKKYSQKVPNVLGEVLSFAGNVDFFDEERRAMDFDEIVTSSEELNIDFVKLGLVPVIDAYDNTYIVYSFFENVWAKYNIIDKTMFKKKENLEDVL